MNDSGGQRQNILCILSRQVLQCIKRRLKKIKSYKLQEEKIDQNIFLYFIIYSYRGNSIYWSLVIN